jgi:integrase
MARWTAVLARRRGRRCHTVLGRLQRGDCRAAVARRQQISLAGDGVQEEHRLSKAFAFDQGRLPWLDRIAEHFGDLSIAQFNRPEKIRPVILRWRNRFADRPRTADYALQVISRVLSHAVNLGKLAGNPCEGFKLLYSVDRSGRRTDNDIATLKRTCSAEINWAVDLAAHTGLRRGDLLRLSWSHIGDDAIVITTSKSNHKREAVIPLYDALKSVLADIPRRSPIILTNSKLRPWTVDGFSTVFNKAKRAAGMADADLHFHDLRGTAATRCYLAGLSERVIAEIMGWSEARVATIIRRYVDRSAATKAAIRQLNAHGHDGTGK